MSQPELDRLFSMAVGAKVPPERLEEAVSWVLRLQGFARSEDASGKELMLTHIRQGELSWLELDIVRLSEHPIHYWAGLGPNLARRLRTDVTIHEAEVSEHSADSGTESGFPFRLDSTKYTTDTRTQQLDTQRDGEEVYAAGDPRETLRSMVLASIGDDLEVSEQLYYVKATIPEPWHPTEITQPTSLRLTQGDRHLDLDAAEAPYVAWRVRGCLDRDLPAPDIARWWSRLLRRYDLDAVPAPDHPAWSRWERLTAGERSTTSPLEESVPAFKLHAPGTWLLSEEECRLLIGQLRDSMPSGHEPDEELAALAERCAAWLEASEGPVTSVPVP